MNNFLLPILESAVGIGNNPLLDPVLKKAIGAGQAPIPPINAPFQTPEMQPPQAQLPEIEVKPAPGAIDPAAMPTDDSWMKQQADALESKTGFRLGGGVDRGIIDSSAGLSAVGDISAPMAPGSEQYVQTLQSLLNWG